MAQSGYPCRCALGTDCIEGTSVLSLHRDTLGNDKLGSGLLVDRLLAFAAYSVARRRLLLLNLG